MLISECPNKRIRTLIGTVTTLCINVRVLLTQVVLCIVCTCTCTAWHILNCNLQHEYLEVLYFLCRDILWALFVSCQLFDISDDMLDDI